MTLLYSLLFIAATFFIFSFLLFIFSSIPFYPTNKKDLPLIVKTLLDEKTDLIIDLGAGSGTVIFAAATKAYQKKIKVKFLAVEIHPLLVLIMHLQTLLHPNKKNIKIKRADIFKFSHSTLRLRSGQAIQPLGNLTIYLYLNPQSLKKLEPDLTKLTQGSIIISYMYHIPSWENKLIKIKEGVNKIFVYGV